MPFDLATAKPVESSGFDLGSAKPIDAPQPSGFQRIVGAGVEGFQKGGVPGALLHAGGEARKMIPDVADAAGHKVMDVAHRAGLPDTVAEGAGFATELGMEAIPMVAGGALAKAPEIAGKLVTGGKRLMQSALKPTLEAQKSGKAAQAIDTMLEKGINATEGGVRKLQGEIGNLNDAIAEAIKNSTAKIDVNKAVQAVNEVAQKALYSVKAGSDLQVIKATLTEFFEHPLVQQYGGQLPVQIAQKLKQGSYKKIGDKAYGLGVKPQAEQDTIKGLTRGLKDEIATAVPGISSLNARESELINALKVLERRTMMSRNRDPIGLGALSPSMGHALGWAANRSDTVKSLGARALYSGREQIPAALARLGITGYEMFDSRDAASQLEGTTP